jgi:NAD-dependent SIR2 family protein deacetylase
MARPAVVWFGEPLGAIWEQAESAAQSAEVFLAAGTSAVVYPAAGLVPLAKQSGARVIEVNLEETPFSRLVDCFLQGMCGDVLPALFARE